MILLLFALSQNIDFEDLYGKATTSLVQFQVEQESAFALLVDLGKDTLDADTTIAFLVAKFDTKGARERHRMKDIFREIGEPAISGIVRNVTYRGSDEESRSLKQSLWVLGEIGSEKIVDPVSQFINDEQWQIRSGALTALGKAKSRKALPFIVQGLNDSIQVVRKSAYYALSQIATLDDFEYLIGGLDDSYYAVRYAAVKGLVDIGQTISETLVELIGESTLKDYYILKILGQLDIPEEQMLSLVEQVSPETRVLIYETWQDKEFLKGFVETEKNVFLLNFLLEKIAETP